MDEMKVCSVCAKEKPLSGFYRHAHRGYQDKCIPCKAEYNREHYRLNRSAYIRRSAAQKKAPHYLDSRLKREYGICSKEYDRLLKAQSGCCGICGQPDSRRALSVDHCHSTGAVRGLLCSKCNRSIGLLGDTVESLEKALKYLKGR